MPVVRSLRSAALPLSIFVGVAVIHYAWVGLYPEQDPLQDRWIAVRTAMTPSWLQLYIETRSYWLGFSYALSIAFAAVALRRYREKRFCATRNLAIGGVTFSGFLAVAGCYLIGCCGSPMLAVYLSLSGTAFLPLAKPLVALLTTIFISAAWWWMNRSQRSGVRETAQES